MAPTLSEGRPIEETLVQPPKSHRHGIDHGPHSVSSTYSKKDAIRMENFQVRQEELIPKKSLAISGIEPVQEPAQKASHSHKTKVIPVKNSSTTDSEEMNSKEDETQIKNRPVTSLPAIDKPVTMETLSLHRHRPDMAEPKGVLISSSLVQNRDGVMSSLKRNNQGFVPYDRQVPFDHGFHTYGVSSPVIRNGRIFYPSLPSSGGFHYAREISSHPHIQLEQTNSHVGNLPSFNPAFRHDTAASETHVTTVRPKPTKKISLKSRPKTTTVKVPRNSVPPTDHPFYDPNYDFTHFEKELADFSNLYHHQKSLEELARNEKDVAVRGDDWLLSGEGATAIILVGMCSIIMMLICLIFGMKKYRKSKNGDKMDELEEKRPPHVKDLATMWMDLYNPVNLIPQISFLHTLPQVPQPDNPKKEEDPPILPIPSSMPQLPMPSFIKIDDYTETHLGRLWFSVRYEPEKSSLHVNVRHARYPKGRGVTSKTGELWVEGIVLSAMNTMKASSKTNTRRATHSPVFNHSFLFLINNDEVNTCILKLKLHDKHPKKEEEVVGSIILPLSSIDLTSTEIHCRDLI